MTAPSHAIAVPPGRIERVFLITVVVLALGWSLVIARDRLTWLLEVVWVIAALFTFKIVVIGT